MDKEKLFREWGRDIHTIPDQKKRLASAKAAKTTPNSVDKESLTGIFPGSGALPYQTSLSSCTCGDFLRRRLPCKHIYRLAIELGLINEVAESGVNKNAFNAGQMTLRDAVAELENMSDEAQEAIQWFLYGALFQDKSEFYIYSDNTSDQLLRCALLSPCDSGKNAFSLLKRNQIIEILDQHGIAGFKRNISHSKLIEWCLENVENFESIIPRIYTFRFTDKCQKVRRRLYSYLLRKYEWDFYYNENMEEIRYPHGAKFEGVSITIGINPKGQSVTKSEGNPYKCHFPDDEITELLTLYGHNRCLNGFVVERV